MNKLTISLWAIVILAGGTATALFLAQGGFGAGRGRFDRALLLLGFPWSFVPWPERLLRNDFLWLVLLPIVINAAIVFALTITVRRLKSA